MAGGRKRSYTKVSDKQRIELIELLKQNMSIKDAADFMGINYENAKVIYRVYRIENRKTKQPKRQPFFANEIFGDVRFNNGAPQVQ